MFNVTCPEGRESRRVEFLPIVAPIIEEKVSRRCSTKVPFFTALFYGSSDIKITVRVRFLRLLKFVGIFYTFLRMAQATNSRQS